MTSVTTHLTREIAARERSTLSRDIAEDRVALLDGRRVRRASDDPEAAAAARTLSRIDAGEMAFAANRRDLAHVLASADAVHADRAAMLTRAMELAVGLANDAGSAEATAAGLAALDDLAQQLAHSEEAVEPLNVPISAGILGRLARPEPTAHVVRDLASAVRQSGAEGARGSLTALKKAMSAASDARTADGLLAQRIETLDAAAERGRIDRDDAREAAVGIDPAEVIARIQSRQLTLDAANALFARLDRSTLFDLLR